MKRRVDWSVSSIDDLARQIEFIASEDPDAAQRVANVIRAAGMALGDFATGHPGRVSGTYEKSVRGLPYILAYALNNHGATVTILRVIHAARDWRPEAWPD